MLPVIICSHNRPRLLKQAIDSLKKNSDSKLQIIVVDDSDQGSLDEIKQFLPKSVTFYHFKTQATIGQAKLKGNELAKKSKYIYFSDDDVYFLPYWDTLLIKILKQNEDIAIAAGRGMHGGSDSRQLNDKYTINLNNVQAGYSMMFRRQEYDQYGWWPNYNEDSWISREVTSRLQKKVGVINPPVILHVGRVRVTRQAEGMNDIPHDIQTIEEDISKYPEVIFE